MKPDELLLTMIRGVIAGMPTEQQNLVQECADKLRATIAEYGDVGKVALTLIGAEQAVEG